MTAYEKALKAHEDARKIRDNRSPAKAAAYLAFIAQRKAARND